VGVKRCSKCQVEKDESDFYVYKKTGKLWGKCKACHVSECVARDRADPQKSLARCHRWRSSNPGRASAISRAWQLRHPEKFRQSRAKIKFSIDFDAMWVTQGGLCACCGLPMQREGKDPTAVCVDHDRSGGAGKKSCGKCVRGLIHRNCNLVLGYAKDDLKVLRAAVEYLEKWEARRESPPSIMLA